MLKKTVKSNWLKPVWHHDLKCYIVDVWLTFESGKSIKKRRYIYEDELMLWGGVIPSGFTLVSWNRSTGHFYPLPYEVDFQLHLFQEQMAKKNRA